MIYLDNAATTWPKPPTVAEAMTRTIQKYGANPGRAGHQMAMAAGRIIWQLRERLCEHFNAADPAAFALTQNCTMALNLGIKGSLISGGHVITTVLEHNSVLRPLHTLEAQGRIRLTLLQPASGQHAVQPEQVRQALCPDTRLVVMSHASNVTGAVQPIEAVASICAGHSTLFMVDAAQTAGVLPIDLNGTHIDLLAFPGHKGLYGPQGTGGLYIRPGLQLTPVLEGGTGSDSHSVLQPDDPPERYESGTLNTPGYAGLSAALRYIRLHQDAIRQQEEELCRALWQGLESAGVTLYGPGLDQPRVGVVCFNIGQMDSGSVADQLDRGGIACRAGLHCAPLIHRHQGSLEQGAVRLSVGCFNTKADIRQAVQAICELREMQ